MLATDRVSEGGLTGSGSNDLYTSSTKSGFGNGIGKSTAVMGKFTVLLGKFTALMAATTYLGHGWVRGNDGRNRLGACTPGVWRVGQVAIHNQKVQLQHSTTNQNARTQNGFTDVVLDCQRVKRDHFSSRTAVSVRVRVTFAAI